jgi:uncharacterized membrane protein YdjX (TVP38/TMEM64 family)
MSITDLYSACAPVMMPPTLHRRRDTEAAAAAATRNPRKRAYRLALLVAVAAPVCIFVLQLLSAALFGLWLLSLAALFAIGGGV